MRTQHRTSTLRLLWVTSARLSPAWWRMGYPLMSLDGDFGPEGPKLQPSRKLRFVHRIVGFYRPQRGQARRSVSQCSEFGGVKPARSDFVLSQGALASAG